MAHDDAQWRTFVRAVPTFRGATSKDMTHLLTHKPTCPCTIQHTYSPKDMLYLRAETTGYVPAWSPCSDC